MTERKEEDSLTAIGRFCIGVGYLVLFLTLPALVGTKATAAIIGGALVATGLCLVIAGAVEGREARSPKSSAVRDLRLANGTIGE